MVVVLKRHLDPTLAMLRRAIAHCPDDLWLGQGQGTTEASGPRSSRLAAPFWQIAYHTVYFLDYWLREDYSIRAGFLSLTFDKDLTPDLGRRCADHLTKTEMKAHLDKAGKRVERIFASLDDERLLERIRPQSPFTYADAILAQIRHIQHHAGQLNAILRRAGAKAAGWQGYGED